MIKCFLIIAAVFGYKCIKELIDVNSMEKMTTHERLQVLEKRHFYDNHA